MSKPPHGISECWVWVEGKWRPGWTGRVVERGKHKNKMIVYVRKMSRNKHGEWQFIWKKHVMARRHIKVDWEEA